MKDAMKVSRFLVFIFLFLLCGVIGFAAAAPPQFGYQALKIDGKYVDPAIFEEEENRFFLKWSTNAMMLKKSDEERMDLLLEDIINRVAAENYLYNYSKVTVTAGEVDNYIKKYIKTRYPTQSELADYMAYSKFESEAQMKQGVKLYLLKLKCFPKIAREMGVSIPAAELAKKYQQHVADSRRAEVKHILITDPDPAKAKKKAEEVYRQLKNGAEFGKMVTRYSADAGTKSTGGLMGSFTKGTLQVDVEEKIFNAKPGTLIPPFQVGSGYEIYLVQKFIGFYHPKAEYTDMLLVEEFGKSDQLKKWLTQVKKKMSIEITDPAMKAYRLSANRQYDQAGTYYEKAFAVYNNEKFLTRAGESYRSSKNWSRLIKLGQLGMKKYPRNVPYHLDTAEGLYRSGKTKDALNLMKKAESLSKDSIYYTGMIKNLYSTLGLKKEADRLEQKLKKMK